MRPEVASRLALPEYASAVEAIARDVYARFTADFVEGQNLCPFARGARDAATSVVRVCLEPQSEDGTLCEGSALAAMVDALLDEEGAEVIQVIFPLSTLDAKMWERWAKTLTAKIRTRRAGPAIWAVAAFHPELSWSDASPAEAIPLFRRSPDPTLQWLRLDALERVRRGRQEGDVALPSDPRSAAAFLAEQARPSLADRVAENNHRTANKIGWSILAERFKDLADEAQRRYSELLPGAVALVEYASDDASVEHALRLSGNR
jgi:hypothetical protein